MSLIGRLLGTLLKTGSLTLVEPGGKRATCGPGGGPHLTVRFADRRVAFDIARNPRLGFGEAYMDGRLFIGPLCNLYQILTKYLTNKCLCMSPKIISLNTMFKYASNDIIFADMH
jgi:cyclopropane-fatty-acyl-phospholipid synthase